MRDFVILLVHLIVTLARLARPGGLRSVVAESVLVKHQLLILNRGRKRAPNRRAADRILAALGTLFMRPARVLRSSMVWKPSTLLYFHNLLRKRKYRMLFSRRHGHRRGPKGPENELIGAVVEMKRRNPNWGCPRIAQQIALAFGVEIAHRTHPGLDGRLPEPEVGGSTSPIDLGLYRWQRYCRGLYQTPIAA